MRKTLLTGLALVLLLTLTACQVKGNTKASISLAGNPTTGYQWTYTISDEKVLAEESNDYVQDKAAVNMTGVGGTYHWTFKALKEGTVDVVFTYSRSFDPKADDEIITYQFKVDAKGNLTYVNATSNITDIPKPVLN